MLIKLEGPEMRVAATVGITRRICSILAKRVDKLESGRAGWDSDIEGAAGEMAVAKYLKVYWDGSVDTFKDPDIMPDIEVRTRSEDWMELPVRHNDDPERFVFLVTGRMPNYTIQGYIKAKHAKQEKWLKRLKVNGKETGEHYYVPPTELHPPEEFTPT